MPRLALSLLGPFRARVGERAVADFATDKARALLAYLAVEADRPHRRDTLAALLWPDWDDAAARSNLRLALHRVRKSLDAAEPALSNDLFGITRETVQVHARAVDLDVARFIALLEMCELHPHRLLHLCPSCLSQLGEAAALYGGELLAGLSIVDAPGFEQWELMRREELGQRVLALLHRLTEAFERLGDHSRGLLFAHRQLALDPYREEAHRQVMRLYALQGERAAALTHYSHLRRLLADELGIEPDAATVELAEQIRAGQTVAPVSAGRPLLYHFPAQFTPFFGRAAEVARLADLLADEATTHSRLLTIVAPGGMGKTRLAVAVAEALAQRPGYPDGIFFLSLARVSSADLLPSALAGVLGLNLGGAAEPVEQLADFLTTRTTLLVLDNFEHLLDGTDLVLRLLEAGPGLRLLITSREALNVRAEERFLLGQLDEQSTILLFTSAAARVRPDYDPDPTEQAGIADICRVVGGMPLAVELAATWVRLMDAPAIAAQIRADLDFLSTKLRDLPERQRSMRAVFNYMWATLSPPEQQALAALSVLRGPFRIDAAAAIAGASPDVLALLLDQSLLRAGYGGSIELHELLRQYAAGKLAAEPEREQVARGRHASHYLALLKAHGAVLGRPGSKGALAALLRNLDNIRAAWGWTILHAPVDEVVSTAPSLKLMYRFSGLIIEGAEAFAAARAALETRMAQGSLAASLGTPVVYDLLEFEGTLLDLGGRMQAALDRLEAARAGWASVGDRRRLCHVLSDMGQVNVRMARMAEAHRLLDPALELARELGDQELLAFVLHNKGTAVAWSGDPSGGQALLEESVAHYRAAGDQSQLGGTLIDLAAAYAFKHDIDVSRILFRQSLSIAESIGDSLTMLWAWIGLGSISLDSGDLAAAEQYSRQALALAQDLGEQHTLPVALGNLAHIFLANGNRVAALRAYIDAMTMTRTVNLDYMLSEVMNGLAYLGVEGEPAAAARWLGAVEGWRRALGYTSEQAFLSRLASETRDRLRAVLGDSAYEARHQEGLALSLEAAAGEAEAWAEGELYGGREQS